MEIFSRRAAEVRDEGDICGQEWLKLGACISFLSTNFHHGWLPRTEDERCLEAGGLESEETLLS